MDKKITKDLLTLAVASALLISAFSCINTHNSDAEMKKKAVMLINYQKGNFCSGEQIQAPSGKNYILSAAHCKSTAQNDGVTVEVRGADEQVTPHKIIAEDANSDLLLLEPLSNVKGLKVAQNISEDQHIRTFTHGGNMPTYKTEGTIIGDEQIEAEIEQTEDCDKYPKNKIVVKDTSILGKIPMCLLSVSETMITALIVHGSSGGMVVNDDGHLVGVVSVIYAPFGGMVRLTDINYFLRGY